MKKVTLMMVMVLFFVTGLMAQNYRYQDSWGKAGFNLNESTLNQVMVTFSVPEFSLEDADINGEQVKNILLPGNFLPNDAGAPNLPGMGRYIAIPEGAIATVRILEQRTETFQNVNIGCAPVIPIESDDRPMVYNKDLSIYSRNAFFPASPVTISEVLDIRGTDVVVVGITPFQYNPVTKELVVIRDVKIALEFTGGNGTFGNSAFRSPYWDGMMQDQILNFQSLPEVNYAQRMQDYLNRNTDDDECEYIIISPDGAEFQSWADSIRKFRMEQGILTKVFTLTEVGGNTEAAIKAFIDNAYNNWTIKPAACLLFGDYGSDASKNITSHMYSHPAGYPNFASDNYFADVTNDNLPDVVFARIVANTNAQLQVLVSKILDYETTPPTDQLFYEKPVTALGWQTERWFQMCSEITGGFFKYEYNKNPRRINAVYIGNPNSDPWSTATNTSQITSYFGPSGLGYIPSTPQGMPCCWTGGTATKINQAIDSGAFAVFHRDHGEYTGWGEPSYHSNNIDQLNNTLLTFVWSINCQTGAFHRTSECFAERFVRHTKNGHNAGAVGIIAATEVSYSFVNDTYLWGSIDNMWPNFMPDKPTTPNSRGLMPAFGNAAGKHFLKQSSWPYNSGDKLITYRLFHMLGDAFQCIYSEVPTFLTVTHDPEINYGSTTFTVTATDSSFIALTANDEILATAYGDAPNATVMTIPVLPVGTMVKVVVTKTNHFRYSDEVEVTTAQLIANFSANTTTVCVGSTIDFSDQSSAAPETWAWTFSGGNPGTSTVQNPTGILYETPGDYDVSLTVTQSGMDPSTETKTGYIHVIAPPTVDFSSTAGCTGTPVQFTDMTNPNGGTITSWAWEFGDGNVSTEQNPAHTFETVGTYSVKLTVVNNGLCDSFMEKTVEISTIPEAAAMPEGPVAVCMDQTGLEYTTAGAVGASLYTWVIYPAEAGTVSGTTTTALVDLATGYKDPFTLKVVGINDCGEGAWSGELSIAINTVPDAPGTPAGVDSVNLNKVVTADFSTNSVPNTASYTWTLTPESAGSITGTDTAATATFTREYTGEVIITVMGVNECGESVASGDKKVILHAPVGITELNGMGIRVYPNPASGKFNIELTSAAAQNISISILNPIGTAVYQEQNVSLNGKLTRNINLGNVADGVYYIRIESSNGNLIHKLVIQK